MADDSKTLNELQTLTQDIVNRFETALNVSTTSQLSSVVDIINQSLAKQANLIQNIKINTSDRTQKLTDESKIVKGTTDDVEKQSKIYHEILNYNEDISDNWEQMIKKSSTLGKKYDDLNKKQKQYLTTLNASAKQEKKLTTSTLNRVKKIGNVNKKNPKLSQFVNPQNILSNQIQIESATGGKPYFASHPEMGVPLGLFNTKDEPNKGARIKAIQKYGVGGSMSGVFPQYADNSSSDTGGVTEITEFAGSAALLEVAKKKMTNMYNVAMEVVTMANNFADKLQDYAGSADEAIRKSVQGTGTLMSKKWGDMFKGETPLSRAAYFQKGMQDAVSELNINEGVFASYESLSELQKAFTDYSKTNVLLNKDDLKQMTYLKTTFDLAASDVGDIKGAFMDMGLSTKDMMEYSTNLAIDAEEYGVSASKLLKDTTKLMKLGAAYRFKGGVKDMEKIQAYAASARFKIENAYDTMDKAMSVEGSVDMSSQLQSLGFNVDSLDLMSAAGNGDIKDFTDQMIGVFQQQVGKFGTLDENGGFKFSSSGFRLLQALKKIDGLKLSDDLENVITQSAKVTEVRKRLLASPNRDQYLNLSKEDQDKLVNNFAQGAVNGVNIWGKDFFKEKVDLANLVFDKSSIDVLKTSGIGEETAKGDQSVKDKIELNEQITKIYSQQRDSFDSVRESLDKMKPTLEIIGESINQLGKAALSTDFFRKINLLNKDLGLSVEESVMFRDYFKRLADGQIPFARLLKGGMGFVQDPVGTVMGGVKKPLGTTVKEQNNVADEIENKSGGLLEAAGGMVMGPSHSNGGVRGTGRFNNVEVEGGEAIINKNSTRMFLPLLSKLNEIGGGEAFAGSSDIGFGGSNISDKTINIKINGNLNYVSKSDNKSTLNVIDIAEEIENLTSGKSFGGVY